MPRRINILPDHLANQIAAGEVVERPASAVKELVENALDAAARRIDIALQNGGKSEIRVADDGAGMGREDALVALDRHATSKIATATDLVGVRTFGFRGEALPSIAAVSRMEIECAESGSVGTRVRVAAGKILGVEDCARQPGTTVVVRNLFFNVPARAKFLRSAAAETRAVVEVATALALANLSASFRLVSNDRVLFQLPAAPDLVSRVAALWGDEVAATLVPVTREEGGLTIAGLVQRPDAATTSARRVHLFVGGRPVRDRGLVIAAERAYRTTVPFGAKPSLLLYLDAEAGAVDVNVHPTKAEVRFRDRLAVEAAVEAAVRDALKTAESAATLDRAPALPQLRWIGPDHGGESRRNAIAPDAAAGQFALFVAAAEPGDARGSPSRGGAPAEEERPSDAPSLPAAPPSLWQIHDTYIVAETRSGLLIIDQHSAHERVLFEEMMGAFENGGVESQRLLFPLTLRLSPAEYALVDDLRGMLTGVGYEVEPFGGRTIIVHAAPVPHPYFDAEQSLRDMLPDLTEGSELTRAARNQHERIAMTFACKAAIKAGQRLTSEEMLELFHRLFATELPHHDVHGRPTIVRLSLTELERRFGRHG